MTTTAVAMFLLRPTYQPRVDPAAWRDAVPDETAEGDAAAKRIGPGVVAAVVAPFYGAAILAVGTALWMAMAGDGPLRVREPGHWLLLIVGTAFPGITLLARVPDSGAITLLWGVTISGATVLLVGSIVLTVCATVDEDNPPAWRWTFPLFSAGVACCCSPMFVVGLLCLVAAVVQDVLCGRQRDLAHWVGVATASRSCCTSSPRSWSTSECPT